MWSWFNKTDPVKNRKGKKKKKLKKEDLAKVYVNPIADLKIVGYSKMGYGPKKTECQDSLYIYDGSFADDCYFFAVYDGHGSSGKEASNSA